MRSPKGSVVKVSDGRWRVRVEMKPDPVTNKRRRKDLIVRGTRREAEEVKLKLLSEQGITDAGITFGEYVRIDYLPTKEKELKRKTLTEYKRRLRLHVLPELESVPLKDLDAQRIKRFLATIEKPTIAKEAYKVLRSVLSLAVYDECIEYNPCDKVRIPKVPEYKPEVLSIEDAVKYLELFKGSSVEAAVLVAIGAGLRRGEICALNVEDINWQTGAIAVNKSYVSDGSAAYDETPKTARGTRIVHLPPSILERLHEIAPESGALLKGRNGRMHPDAVRKTYARTLEKLPPDVPRVPLKNLRHTSLTFAYDSGADMLALQDRGGHADIGTTKRYYLRPHEARDIAIAEAMDEQLREALGVSVGA